MKRVGWLVVAAAACSSPSEDLVCGDGTELVGTACVASPPDPLTCDPGTHLDGDRCVPDTRARVEIRVAPQIAAGPDRRVPVRVFATNADGTPASEPLVLNTDRPGAGMFSASVVTPGPLGADVFFRPCDLALPGCTGPLSLTVARVEQPTVVVGTASTAIVDPAELNPARACLTGGNVLKLDGDDEVFTGSAMYTDAAWEELPSYQDLLRLRVTPAGDTRTWTLLFTTMYFSPVMVPRAYPDARRAVNGSPWILVEDHPAMALYATDGTVCETVEGSFEIVDYKLVGQEVDVATVVFEQFCNGNTTTSVSGCLHYTRGTP